MPVKGNQEEDQYEFSLPPNSAPPPAPQPGDYRRSLEGEPCGQVSPDGTALVESLGWLAPFCWHMGRNPKPVPQ